MAAQSNQDLNSKQIEDMGPFANQLAGTDHPLEPPWGAELPPDALDGNFTDAQQVLDLIGEQPLSEEMLKTLQERFGPIEIEIVEESSEESGDRDASGHSVEEGVADDTESGSFNVWPQQPIVMHDTGHVPLLVELEQAEEVERLSQEVAHGRVRNVLDDSDSEDGENAALTLLGEAAGQNADPSAAGAEAVKSSEDDEVVNSKMIPNRRKSGHPPGAGSLRAPWLSPVPFVTSLSQEETTLPSAPSHSTPHNLSGAASAGRSDDEDSGLHAEDAQEGNNNQDIGAQGEGEIDENQGGEEADEYTMEVDLEDLTQDELRELLMTSQLEGLDPQLVELAARRGLEFEIVMEDEDGNIIEGVSPMGDQFPGQPMSSSNFNELLEELRTASGHQMELAMQYEQDTGSGEPNNGNKTGITSLQQDILHHLQTTDPSEIGDDSGGRMVTNAPTTSLDDLAEFSDEEGRGSRVLQCTCSSKTECSVHPAQGSPLWTQQHFHNTNQKLGEHKKYASGQFLHLQDTTRGVRDEGGFGTTDQEETEEKGSVDMEVEIGAAHQGETAGSSKSSEGDSDEEGRRGEGEEEEEEEEDRRQRRKFSSSRSDKSFSSSTSIDGVIDTRADHLDESEEEIVITMEVPGIPTEDGGFIIDMSKMFIPISLPGADGAEGEITVEIDPSTFDFSSMVQNDDGTIEVDIEREVHNWMAKSAAKFVNTNSTSAPISPAAANRVVYASPGGDSQGAGYESGDSEVNSAIRAAVSEQLHCFPGGPTGERKGPTIRPLSATPPPAPAPPQSVNQDDSNRASGASSASLFDVSPAEDEVLQLLEQIGKHGQEMKKELEISQQREICLHHERTQEEMRLADSLTAVEKELVALRAENKKLYRDLNTGRTNSSRDQNTIQRLEEAMDELQNRVHAFQRENTDLKKVNATLERRSRMVMHKGTLTDHCLSDQKATQTGSSAFRVRSRAIQSQTINTADFAVQQYGHHFLRNAVTSTQDPIFRSLTSKSSGTQTTVKLFVDRGVLALSAQEKLWFGCVAHASTQVRSVSKQHESTITRKATRDASTTTVAPEQEYATTPMQRPQFVNRHPVHDNPKADQMNPWQHARQQQQELQHRRTSTPVKASQALKPLPLKPVKSVSTNTTPVQSESPVEKIFSTQTQSDSTCMENSATESMDTEEEPEGPDKWQRLSSAPLTSDPTVVKLQRSLASATLENDLLQTKMKKAKEEMSSRLEEWADLLQASKAELQQAKYDAVGLTNHHQNHSALEALHNKIGALEQTLLSAQQQNNHLVAKLDSAPIPQINSLQDQDLQHENSELKSTLEKVQGERDQLVKDFGHLRQHHRHSIEAVTELESSLVGMASERQNLQKEVQILRDEYQNLRKGMDVVDRYISKEDSKKETLDTGKRPSPGGHHAASQPVTSSAVRDTKAGKPKVKKSEDPPMESTSIVLRTNHDLEEREDEDETTKANTENAPGAAVSNGSAGAVEGSLHKHISALAARIQSELGIKVQLVGEVDPAEILGSSIHSQEDSGASTSTVLALPEEDHRNAVEHLFQSVRPDGARKKVVVPQETKVAVDLQEVEDIIARAIPSPRDASPDSLHSEHLGRSDIENLDTVQLRRKRLGMFVDAYTKQRETSPEARSASPRGRTSSSASPTGRKSSRSPPSRPELALEDLETSVEPSTDHHMKMYKESRHQIQSQEASPTSEAWSRGGGQSESPTRGNDVNPQKPETMRKKLNAGTPLLPSKFSLSSVGVPKATITANQNQTTAPGLPSDGIEPQHSTPWTNPKWRPFSRLAKSARLKQEPRPPSRGAGRKDIEAEAASIQEEILSRYAGNAQRGRDHTTQSPPPPTERSTARTAQTHEHSTHKSPSTRGEELHVTLPASRDQPTALPSAHRKIPDSGVDHGQYSQRHYHPESSALQQSSKTSNRQQGSQQAVSSRTLFKDGDYTDYLLAKYGGDEESTDASPLSEPEGPSDYRSSSSPFSSHENGEAGSATSSDSDMAHRAYPTGESHVTAGGFSREGSRLQGLERFGSRGPSEGHDTLTRGSHGTSPANRTDLLSVGSSNISSRALESDSSRFTLPSHRRGHMDYSVATDVGGRGHAWTDHVATPGLRDPRTDSTTLSDRKRELPARPSVSSMLDILSDSRSRSPATGSSAKSAFRPEGHSRSVSSSPVRSERQVAPRSYSASPTRMATSEAAGSARPSLLHSTRTSSYSPRATTAAASSSSNSGSHTTCLTRPEAREPKYRDISPVSAATTSTTTHSSTPEEDRYWTEPKAYDYRHEISSGSWRDLRRNYDSPLKTKDPEPEPSSRWSESLTGRRSQYDAYSSSASASRDGHALSTAVPTPYSSTADRYRFQTRAEPERDTPDANRRNHYEQGSSNGGSSSGSMMTPWQTGYSQGYYDRTTPAIATSQRNLSSSRTGGHSLVSEHRTSLYPSHHSRCSGNDEDVWTQRTSPDLSPLQGGRSSVDRLVAKYSSLAENAHSSYRGSYSQPPSSGSYNCDYRDTPLGSYSAGGSLLESDVYSRRFDVPETRNASNRAFPLTDHGFLTASAEISPATAQERGRRSEIEELLNKYAPLH